MMFVLLVAGAQAEECSELREMLPMLRSTMQTERRAVAEARASGASTPDLERMQALAEREFAKVEALVAECGRSNATSVISLEGDTRECTLAGCPGDPPPCAGAGCANHAGALTPEQIAAFKAKHRSPAPVGAGSPGGGSPPVARPEQVVPGLPQGWQPAANPGGGAPAPVAGAICDAPVELDSAPLQLAAQQDDALAGALLSVWMDCYDANGGWSAGMDAVYTSAQNPASGPSDTCGEALAECDAAAAAVSANQGIHGLGGDLLAQMRASYAGQSYLISPDAVVPTELAYDCRASDAGTVRTNADARAAIAAKHRAVASDYQGFRGWLFVSHLGCP